MADTQLDRDIRYFFRGEPYETRILAELDKGDYASIATRLQRYASTGRGIAKTSAQELYDKIMKPKKNPRPRAGHSEWGVKLGVKRIPSPELYVKGNVYGWVIDKHGVYVLSDSWEGARKEFVEAYNAETGENLEYMPDPVSMKMVLSTPKKNPTKRKTAARTQRAAVGYVNRPSQITKAAPSKRLKTRRTKNLQVPRGVFPNPITKYIVYSETKPGQWKQVKVTESFDIAKNLAISNANSGYASTVEDSIGTLIYDTTRPSKYELKKNPSSVHFDIDVNSHNARGSKAKTRTNPVSRVKAPAGKEKFIRVELKYGNEWEILSLFPKTNEGAENAIMYAKAYHVKEPKATIRVME